MGITPLVVKQKEFTTRFRGFDVQEVDYFLEDVARELDQLNNSIQDVHEENHRLNLENQGYRKREDSMKDLFVRFLWCIFLSFFLIRDIRRSRPSAVGALRRPPRPPPWVPGSPRWLHSFV